MLEYTINTLTKTIADNGTIIKQIGDLKVLIFTIINYQSKRFTLSIKVLIKDKVKTQQFFTINNINNAKEELIMQYFNNDIINNKYELLINSIINDFIINNNDILKPLYNINNYCLCDINNKIWIINDEIKNKLQVNNICSFNDIIQSQQLLSATFNYKQKFIKNLIFF